MILPAEPAEAYFEERQGEERTIISKRPRKKVKFTMEQRALRDTFRDWHPGPEELIASVAAARLP